MTTQDIYEYCLKKKGVTEEFPFGEDTLVFKVGGKLFLLMGLQEGASFNAKCDPDYAVELREQHDEIIPGYHMNKKHWNTVYFNGHLKTKLIFELIDHSYDLVVSKLPKKLREEILG